MIFGCIKGSLDYRFRELFQLFSNFNRDKNQQKKYNYDLLEQIKLLDVSSSVQCFKENG